MRVWRTAVVTQHAVPWQDLGVEQPHIVQLCCARASSSCVVVTRVALHIHGSINAAGEHKDAHTCTNCSLWLAALAL